MTIEARWLEQWIGAEVADGSGEKLGKLEDIYFHGSVPVAVTVRSGLAGRKHHAATLRGATVSRDSLHLDASAVLVATAAEGIGPDTLIKLAGQDPGLGSVTVDALESWTAREQREKDAAQLRANAEQLEDEARRRSEEEAAASIQARDAALAAEEARLAHEEVQEQARQARHDTA